MARMVRFRVRLSCVRATSKRNSRKGCTFVWLLFHVVFDCAVCRLGRLGISPKKAARSARAPATEDTDEAINSQKAAAFWPADAAPFDKRASLSASDLKKVLEALAEWESVRLTFKRLYVLFLITVLLYLVICELHL